MVQTEDKKSFFRRHPILSIFLVLFFLIIVIMSIGSSSKKNSNSNNTLTNGNQNTTNPSQEVVALKVKASNFLSEYNSNEVKADNNYKGKLVEISGIVNSVGVVFGETYVLIQGGQYDVIMVQCYVNEENKSNIENLSKGQFVSMQGIVDGKSLNISVRDCKVVK